MRDLILGLSLLIFGPAGPGLVDLPPPPGLEFDAPRPLKPQGWPAEVLADRAMRRSARSAARRRNMAMLGDIGAQLDAQASVLAAQSAAQTAAFHHRMTNYLSLQNSPYPAVQSPAYCPGWGGSVRGPDCTPSRPASCSAGANCTPSRSSFTSPGSVGPYARDRD